MKKYAVVIAGCGHLDGAEIRETLFTLLALDQHQVEADLFAPDREQHHVVNHLTGQEASGEKRNILIEAARLARGKIQPLKNLVVGNYDGVIFPGGFGAAKNLCDFAFKGAEATIFSDVRQVILEAHQLKKNIGAICIAPAIVALAFKGTSVHPKITLGARGESSEEIKKVGAMLKESAVDGVTVDFANKIVSTPAYMYGNARPSEIFKGIYALVSEIVKL